MTLISGSEPMLEYKNLELRRARGSMNDAMAWEIWVDGKRYLDTLSIVSGTRRFAEMVKADQEEN